MPASSLSLVACLHILVVAAFALAGFAAAQSDPEIEALNQQAAQLYRARRYSEAMTLAERALALAEQRFGPDDVRLARLLNNVALIHKSQGRLADAEPLYKRALSIQEKALGPDHASVGKALATLAEFYRFQLRYGEAEPLLKRFIAIKEKELGPDHPEVSAALNELARLHEYQRQYAEAEQLYRRVLAGMERRAGPHHVDEATALHKLAFVLEMQTRYAEAERLYKRALAMAEQAQGPDHPGLRTWLDRLASLYETQRRYADAEPLYRRALAIMEKAHGPDHPDVREPLRKLAFVLEMQKQYAEAEPLYRRALAIMEKERGLESPSLRIPLDSLASLYKRQGRYAEAELLYKRILALAEKEPGGSDNPNVQRALNDLIDVYRTQARYAEAEPLMRRMLAVAEKKNEADPQNVVSHLGLHNALNRLGGLLQNTNKLAEAEALFRRSLADDEKRWGSLDQHVFTDLINLGGLLLETNRTAEAEPLLRRALALAEGYGPNYEQARALNSLSALLRQTNRFGEAEALLRRALPLAEAFGYEPHIATTLDNLAGLLQETNRQGEAEALYRRALAINEKSFGVDHPNVAVPLNNLATLLHFAKQYAEAEVLFRRALVIGESTYGPEHPKVALRLSNLAGPLHATGRYAEAEPLMRRALAIDEKSYGPAHPRVAGDLNSLAGLLKDTGRVAEAEPLMRRALAIDEQSYGKRHPSVARDLNNLAVLRAQVGDWAQAAALLARAKPVFIGQGSSQITGDREDLRRLLLKQNSEPLRRHVVALHRAAASSAAARAEGFELAQWALQTDAAAALAQMSARLARGDGPLADLVRERQNLMARRQAEDKRLLDAVGRADVPTITALRASIADLDKRLESTDAQLAGKFPEYAELANPKPLAIAQVQSLLNADEALILFLDVKELGPLPEETLSWVITRTTVAWHRIGLGPRALADSVMALRCGFDPTLWDADESAGKCRTALQGSPAQETHGGQSPQALPFDLARAHALYKALLGPVQNLIKDKHLLIVPAGALTSLPFGVLAAEPPRSAGVSRAADYRHAAWLGTRQPISVLPSVASLAALRRHAKASAAPEPYIGYGDPLLAGEPGCPQIVVPNTCPDEQVQVASSAALVRSAIVRSAIPSYFRDGRADVAEVRKLCPLPDTAHELTCVARSLGADPGSVVLGSEMTETAVKKAALNRYRVLHFATHGLLAGETAQLTRARAEPALVMSPPDQPTEEDDGLLTASEVAGLTLDADWVVLSACNTAGGEETGAEALSGLARAFFYAGARALLVSHWPVDSNAATMLTSRTFAEMRKDSTIGRAEAFRRAMRALMSDETRPWAAHPSIWAPFVVVGMGEDLRPPPAAPPRVGGKAAAAKATSNEADDWRKRAFDP